ncbi:MAG: FixH family protein [Burkholderiales bacterium]
MKDIPTLQLPVKPWYREPWPWLIMAGPAAVVVAGVITTVIAFRTSDGLVADDYYKRGLTINRTLAREDAAAARQVRAGVSYDATHGRVRVTLSGDGVLPAAVTLRLTHPTRAGLDHTLVLAHLGGGVYEGSLRLAEGAGARWIAFLETAEWRLVADWNDPARRPLAMAPAAQR